MKTYIILSLLLLSTLKTYAQLTIIPLEDELSLTSDINNDFEEDNVYFKDVNDLLGKYIGEWVYDDGTHYLRINIELFENHLRGGGFPGRPPLKTTYEDALQIRYQYKENGVEIYNTLDSNRDGMNMSFLSSSNKILFHYDEPTDLCHRYHNAFLEIDFIESIPENNLQWQRKYFSTVNERRFCSDGTNADISPLRLPEVMTFSRM